LHNAFDRQPSEADKGRISRNNGYFYYLQNERSTGHGRAGDKELILPPAKAIGIGESNAMDEG
jgi:hypothetical protein